MAAGDSGAARVVLAVTGCPAHVEAELHRIVGMEIGDLLIEGSAPAQTDRLAVSCTEDSVHLLAESRCPACRVDRTLHLNDFPPDAVPRALALAGVELLASLSPAVRHRLEARGADQNVPLGPPVVALSTRSPTWRADAALVWLNFLGDSGLSLWGGRARIAREIGRRLSLGLDMEAASGSRAAALGQVRGVLGSAGAFVGVHAGQRDVFTEIALGGRMGVAYLAGEPGTGNVAGNRVSRAWGGPALSLRLWAGHGSPAFGFCAESGLALLGGDGLAGDVTAVSVRNFWVSLALGVGLRL